VADLRPFQLDHLGTQVAKGRRGGGLASARAKSATTSPSGKPPWCGGVWFTMSIALIEHHQRRDDWREGVA
jgi:hypothetical protein